MLELRLDEMLMYNQKMSDRIIQYDILFKQTNSEDYKILLDHLNKVAQESNKKMMNE